MHGELLLDRYRILDTLGRGATSTVVKAFDTRMERQVAIKIIPAEKHTAQRALREARTTALLNHPNIVTVHDFEQGPDGYYLVMEYADGLTLEQLLADQKRLPEEVALAIAIQACEGLENAHSNDIVHRDIKPANLMVMPDGRVRVMDFGISRLSWVPITREGSIVGTFSYMSPEQAAGELVDERSDIFSLGVVLYEMLTGTNPFDASGAKASVFKIRETSPPPPSHHQRSITPEVDDVVMRALEKFPGERYDLATDFRYKLERHRSSSRAPTRIVADYLASIAKPVASDRDDRPLTYLLTRWHDLADSWPIVERLPGAVLIVAYWLWLSQGASWPQPALRAIIAAVLAATSIAWLPAGLLIFFTVVSAGFWSVSPLGTVIMAASSFTLWLVIARKHHLAILLAIGGPVAGGIGAPMAPALAAGGTLAPALAGPAAVAALVAYWLTAQLPIFSRAWPALHQANVPQPDDWLSYTVYLALWALTATLIAVVSRWTKRLRVVALAAGATAMFWGYRSIPLPTLLHWVTLSFIISLVVATTATSPLSDMARQKPNTVGDDDDF